MDLGFLLKTAFNAMGIKIPDQTARELEVMIPQIPKVLQDAVKGLNDHFALMDQRMKELETRNRELTEHIIYQHQARERENHELSLQLQRIEHQLQQTGRECQYGRNRTDAESAGIDAGSGSGNRSSSSTRKRSNGRA
jgi:hypothetical protein